MLAVFRAHIGPQKCQDVALLPKRATRWHYSLARTRVPAPPLINPPREQLLTSRSKTRPRSHGLPTSTGSGGRHPTPSTHGRLTA